MRRRIETLLLWLLVAVAGYEFIGLLHSLSITLRLAHHHYP